MRGCPTPVAFIGTWPWAFSYITYGVEWGHRRTSLNKPFFHSCLWNVHILSVVQLIYNFIESDARVHLLGVRTSIVELSGFHIRCFEGTLCYQAQIVEAVQIVAPMGCFYDTYIAESSPSETASQLRACVGPENEKPPSQTIIRFLTTPARRRTALDRCAAHWRPVSGRALRRGATAGSAAAASAPACH